jgi:hypothetical protein
MASLNSDGLVVIHSIYIPSDNKSYNTEVLYDFTNDAPQEQRIYYGDGFIKIVDNKEYIVSCNHIIINNAEYIAYYKHGTKIIELNLSIHTRIPELDIIIMNIVSKSVDCNLQELNIETNIHYVYTSCNKILTNKYNPNISEISNINYNINGTIAINFCTLVSKYIKGIPSYEFNINDMEIFADAIPERKNIETILKGLSGGILMSDNQNIGMVCKFEYDTNSIKSIPLFFVDKIANIAIMNGSFNLYGIHVDSDRCDIEYDEKELNVYHINERPCGYKNGKKIFYFNIGDIIISVDNLNFDDCHNIYLDELKIFVPLDTYILLKLNIYGQTVIKYSIMREYNNEYKRINYNIMGKSYEQIHNINLYNNTIVRWKNYIFMELSETLIDFYDRIGIELYNRNNIKYSFNGEKIIILLNYNQFIPSTVHTIENYMSYIIGNNKSAYFYELVKCERYKIKNINTFQRVIEHLNPNKKHTFTLIDNSNKIIKLLA